MSRIGVVIIDDSPLTRSLLNEVIRREQDMQVLGLAEDGLAGLDLCRRMRPTVVTVDIEMPRLNGLEFLERVKSVHPCQVLMISSATRAGADQTFRALAAGAFDYVAKPARAAERSFENYAREIVEKIRAAAIKPPCACPPKPELAVRSSRPNPNTQSLESLDFDHPHSIIAIGASTGGPLILPVLLQDHSARTPPIVVAMHMPVPFTGLFANRLQSHQGIPIVEARDGAKLERGKVYLIPGDRHASLRLSTLRYQLTLQSDEQPGNYRPSINLLFTSLAETAGAHGVAIVLSGMGNDGVAGCRALKARGGFVIAQDEASSPMYGMPKVVAQEGLANWVASPAEIRRRLTQLSENSPVT